MNNDLMFSSKSDNWSTPQDFYDKLNKEFKFDLDPCCSIENAKSKKFYTENENGLIQPWIGNVFMNCPYGKEINQWIKKAYESSLSGCLVVGLLPARTDTKYFHDYIYGKAEIRFIKGRLKFGDSKNAAPFPSMVVIWRPVKQDDKRCLYCKSLTAFRNYCLEKSDSIDNINQCEKWRLK